MDGLNDGLKDRLDRVRAAIAAACARAGRRPEEVTLLAVSKTHPAALVAAARALGQRDFGENYAQELRDKARELHGQDLRWHFIGGLQKNKARLVVGTVCLVHSVDSAGLVSALAARVNSARRQPEGGAAAPGPLDCLIEVNTAGEAQKGGVPPGEVPALLDAFSAEGGAVRCVGLMCIPPAPEGGDAEGVRPHFRRLRELLHAERASPRPHVDLRELSMGMSHDFGVAIEEGATIVRIGTAIFGPR